MSYYKNFRIIIGTPLWRDYLRWVYKTSIDDFNKLKFTPDFNKKGFTCLLCGVGNEVTADEFLRFILEKNSQAKIWIIDLGGEQIEAVKSLVEQKYPGQNITIKKINALELDKIIKPGSIDWIETDGLFEFFNNDALEKLLKVWTKLLAKNGFVTTRACSSKDFIDRLMEDLKVWGGKKWLGVTAYAHTRKQMHDLFKKAGFKFVEGSTPLKHFKRYSLIGR